jgi:hypothetical protein
MLQNIRANRPVFITICASIVVIFMLGGLLTWHYLSQPPTPPTATCGIIVYPQGGTQPFTKNVAQIEQCFYHAYQQCSEVNMIVSEHGTDTGASTTYWPVKQGSACRIIAEFSSFSLVSSGNHTETGTCQGVIQKSGGLLFQQCGSSGDVFIRG